MECSWFDRQLLVDLAAGCNFVVGYPIRRIRRFRYRIHHTAVLVVVVELDFVGLRHISLRDSCIKALIWLPVLPA